MAAADDFILPVLALVLELGHAPDALLEELPATVISPEISEKNGYVVSPSPDSSWPRLGGGLDDHLHCWKMGKE